LRLVAALQRREDDKGAIKIEIYRHDFHLLFLFYALLDDAIINGSIDIETKSTAAAANDGNVARVRA
jgi:hypothetical protein